MLNQKIEFLILSTIETESYWERKKAKNKTVYIGKLPYTYYVYKECKKNNYCYEFVTEEDAYFFYNNIPITKETIKRAEIKELLT